MLSYARDDILGIVLAPVVSLMLVKEHKFLKTLKRSLRCFFVEKKFHFKLIEFLF